jgi:hypothetical protein
MQGNLPLDLFLGASNFCSSQTATDNNLDAFGIGTHCLLHRLLHGAAERDALLQLLGDAASHQIGVQLWLADLVDLNFDTFACQSFQLCFEPLNFFTAFANDDARLGGADANCNLVGSGTLDLDRRDCRVDEFLLNGLTDAIILGQDIFVITLGIPARLPALHHTEPEPYGMYFMSQECPPLSLRITAYQPDHPRRRL